MAYKTKAQRRADFESQPRSPKEIRDFEADEARRDREAQQFQARQVEYQSERYTAAHARLADVTYAMRAGGAKTVPGRRAVTDHLSDIARLRAELDKAEREANDATAAIEGLQGQDPVALYEAHLRKFPALADRLS